MTFLLPGCRLTLIRHHIGEVVKNIHRANIHHHDLRIDNFVRAADGMLRIIDFGHSSIADGCEYSDMCPDEEFLAEWG